MSYFDEADELGGFEQRLLHELRAIVVARGQLVPKTRSHRRWRSRRALVAGAAFLSALGGVGGLALAGTLGGGTVSPEQWSSGARVVPEVAMTPDQTAQLGILRRPRDGSDVLPSGLVTEVTNTPGDGGYGLNPSLSRRALGASGGIAWLVPGNGNLCLEVRFPVAGGGGVCGPNAEFSSGREIAIGFSAQAPTVQGVAGVVPDGVDRVTITPMTGQELVTPVEGNVYNTEIPTGAFSVMFTGPTGPITLTETGLPGATGATSTESTAAAGTTN